MKKYIKNKNFIPEKFYNRIELIKSKKENEIIILFLIVNLLLIPMTARYISEIKEEPIINIERVNNTKENKINITDINTWIESLMKDNIEEAYIDNNNGEVIVDNLDEIDELDHNSLIKINDANLNSDGRYKVGVSLYE